MNICYKGKGYKSQTISNSWNLGKPNSELFIVQRERRVTVKRKWIIRNYNVDGGQFNDSWLFTDQ